MAHGRARRSPPAPSMHAAFSSKGFAKEPTTSGTTAHAGDLDHQAWRLGFWHLQGGK